MYRSTLIKWLISCLLVLSYVPAVLADGNAKSVVGTWDVTFENETQRLIATFEKDGGYAGTPALAALTTSQGVWEKVGSRTYAVHSRFFNLDQNSGALLFVADNRELVEVSKDGQTLTSTFVLEVSLPDGTLVSSRSGSTTGVRITVDF